MRTPTLVTLALMLALGTAACARAATADPQVASAGKAPSASPSASASEDPGAPLKFSQCMRAHGISWFPDPVDGKMTVAVPMGTDKKKLDTAQEACKQFMPNGGEPPKPNPEELAQLRNLAKCMRANGIPNFPDPGADGGISIDSTKLGTGPGDPTFDKAEKACAQYQPKGAQRHVEGHSDSGGTTSGRIG